MRALGGAPAHGGQAHVLRTHEFTAAADPGAAAAALVLSLAGERTCVHATCRTCVLAQLGATANIARKSARGSNWRRAAAAAVAAVAVAVSVWSRQGFMCMHAAESAAENHVLARRRVEQKSQFCWQRRHGTAGGRSTSIAGLARAASVCVCLPAPSSS